MDLQLTGKSCLITGASRGIGLGTSKIMASEGCRMALVARRKHLLEELADEIAARWASPPHRHRRGCDTTRSPRTDP